MTTQTPKETCDHDFCCSCCGETYSFICEKCNINIYEHIAELSAELKKVKDENHKLKMGNIERTSVIIKIEKDNEKMIECLLTIMALQYNYPKVFYDFSLDIMDCLASLEASLTKEASPNNEASLGGRNERYNKNNF